MYLMQRNICRALRNLASTSNYMFYIEQNKFNDDKIRNDIMRILWLANI